MVEKPEISPICGKNPAHSEIRVHKICVFLGRTVHTHGRIKGWGKLLKRKPPPFRITKRVSELFRKTENAVEPFRKRGRMAILMLLLRKLQSYGIMLDGNIAL